MKLAIVSVEKQWEIEQTKKAAKKRNHVVEIFHPDDLVAGTDEIKKFDALLLRPIIGSAIKGRAIALAFLRQGTTVVDEKIAFTPGGNKFSNYLEFKQAGLNVPKTLVLNKAALKAVKKWNKEIVIKPLGGKRGREIFKCPNAKIGSLLPKLKKGKEYLVQEFIPFEKELRVLVLGEKVLGAFKKLSADWRKNIARGGVPVKEKVTSKIKASALKAAQAAKLEFCGVDLALSQGKWFVLEANRSPLYKAFQSSHPKINVSEELVKYLEKKVKSKKNVYF